MYLKPFYIIYNCRAENGLKNAKSKSTGIISSKNTVAWNGFVGGRPRRRVHLSENAFVRERVRQDAFVGQRLRRRRVRQRARASRRVRPTRRRRTHSSENAFVEGRVRRSARSSENASVRIDSSESVFVGERVPWRGGPETQSSSPDQAHPSPE